MNHTARVQGPASQPVIFVIDQDARVRGALEALIRRAGWQAETFASGEQFLAHPRCLIPSCLVLDVSLPDLDGLQLQRLLADRSELPIIFMANCVDLPLTVQAMKAGAVEFFTKPVADEALLNALRQALERSADALHREAEMNVLRDRYESLSRREREVMTLVISGRLNKQVGAELGIAEITVKAHRGHLMRKMRASSLPELVTMAATLGVAPLTMRMQRSAAIARSASRAASANGRLQASRFAMHPV